MNGLYLKNVPADLKAGIQILKPLLPIVASAKAGHLVTFDLAPRAPKAEFRVELNKAGEILIHYGKPIHAYRALGILAGKIKLGKALEAFREEEQFNLSAIMLDVSRNAAPKPEVLKEWLARFALMGLNGLTLYTETNYEIPGENFWGYHEGRYTIKDLKELSEHAAKLGIEMFPCIQTLAHLKRALHWDVYGKIKDTETVLMVGKEETYKLIEKMIQAAGKPYA
ncbi:MAG: beta-N-acetylhexosaminidase, partial [Spirochaetia bacterium]|nr:beta-N-acetylhexosaminidase [Spirochaetia bacterium]